MPELSLQFLPTLVTRQQLVDAGRYFIGLPYSAAGTLLWGESDGRPLGNCDCAGLPILVMIRLGLLPANFNANLPFRLWRRPRKELLREMIELNFTCVPRTQRGPGDLLFVKYPNDDLPDGRHVAFCTELQPGYGSMLHALNDLTGCGKVFEQSINGHEFDSIRASYRLNNLAD